MTARTLPLVGVGIFALALAGASVSAQSVQTFGQGAYRPGNGIAAPKLLKSVQPRYTPDALSRKVQGDVELEVVVEKDGSVGDVRVTKGLEPDLDAQALQAARQWQFTSGTNRDGEPVPVIVTLVLSFRARDGQADNFLQGACLATAQGSTAPVLLHSVAPKYTSEALRQKIDGEVKVQAIVESDGSVSRARVVQSLDQVYGLDGQALAAVSHWEFQAGSGKCAGEPAAVMVELVLTFRVH